IRLERYLRPPSLGRAGLTELPRLPALVALLVDLSIPPDLQLKEFGESVDDGNPNSMKPSRDLVGVVVEFASGVELCHNHFRGRLLFLRVLFNRNSPPVVDDRDGMIEMDADGNLIAIPRERLIDAVVHHLVDELVKSLHRGVSDVHGGSLADSFQSLQHLDIA